MHWHKFETYSLPIRSAYKPRFYISIQWVVCPGEKPLVASVPALLQQPRAHQLQHEAVVPVIPGRLLRELLVILELSIIIIQTSLLCSNAAFDFFAASDRQVSSICLVWFIAVIVKNRKKINPCDAVVCCIKEWTCRDGSWLIPLHWKKCDFLNF